MNLYGFDLSTGDLIAGGTGLVGIITALQANRRLRLEGRDSVLAGFQKITIEQRAELDRSIKENTDQRLRYEQRMFDIETELEELRAENKKLKMDVIERDQRISDLEAEVARLKLHTLNIEPGAQAS